MARLRTAGVVLTLLSVLVVAAPAFAAPPGVVVKDGVWLAPNGKALYSFSKDVAPNRSTCNGPCATAWPPLSAPLDAKAEGDWTLVQRDDNTKQWAYKGQPLYEFAKDAADGVATGVSASWPLAKP